MIPGLSLRSSPGLALANAVGVVQNGHYSHWITALAKLNYVLSLTSAFTYHPT